MSAVTTATIREEFEKAGFVFQEAKPLNGLARLLGQAGERGATLELLGGPTLVKATLVTVMARDARPLAAVNGRRLAALLALAAPELLRRGWLAGAIRTAGAARGKSQQVAVGSGARARLTHNPGKSTTTLMVSLTG